MVGAIKPFKSDKNYTILDPFGIGDKVGDFKRLLNSKFIKSNKEITEFRIGCTKEIAQSYAKVKKEEFEEVKISSQLLEISNIQDVIGRNVFQNTKKIFGWLIFIDENIFANWGHDCKYIFYIGKKEEIEEEIIFEENMLFPPANTFLMEVI